MRVSFLKIQNYRSIQAMAIKIPQVCALVGPNNSGKSNILRALATVLGKDWVTLNSFDEDDVYGRDPKKDIAISVRLDPPGQIERFGHKVDIEGIGYAYTRYIQAPRTGQRRLVHEMLDSKGGDKICLPKKRFKKGEQPQWEVITDIPSELKAQIPLIYIGTNRSLKEHLPGARNSLLGQLLKGIDEELRSGAEELTIRDHDGTPIADTRLNHFNALMGRAMETLRTDNFKTLEATIKQHVLEHLGMDPKADVEKLDFHFEPFDTKDFFQMLDLRVKEESGFSISATELGDGLQNAMVLAILRAFESTKKKGAILLIEEPEMFLHPQMQRSLYKTLREIGKNNQVIYTTHSPHFVSAPDYNEVLVVRKGPRGTEVTASDQVLDEPTKLRMQQELDPERNELFFAKRVLVVEGDTEKLTLPVYARRMGIDLDAAGVSILEATGKNNLLIFARISASLGIPTGILFDIDKEPDTEKNAELLSFQEEGPDRRVWASNHDFEAEMRKVMSDAVYEQKCTHLPGVSKKLKPIRIAEDEIYEIPEVFQQALKWLVDREVAE